MRKCGIEVFTFVIVTFFSVGITQSVWAQQGKGDGDVSAVANHINWQFFDCSILNLLLMLYIIVKH